MKRNHTLSFGVISYLLLAGCLLFQAGCGGSAGGPDKRPERVAFSGTATLNGAGIENAFITFHATATPGYGASAKTDANGKFVMGTFTSSDGVVPGDYNVTVMKGEDKAPDPNQILQDDPAYNGAPEPVVEETANVLPAKFEDPKTSGVKVTVSGPESDYHLEFK